jgi:hypothetical protein
MDINYGHHQSYYGRRWSPRDIGEEVRDLVEVPAFRPCLTITLRPRGPSMKPTGPRSLRRDSRLNVLRM